MKNIGGYFSFEQLAEKENHFFEELCPDSGDLAFLMSGRCAIYYTLEDMMLTDHKRIAYVPIYTCETVLAPFEKAGYQMLFYDVDRTMTPVFDKSVLNQISVLSLCGYYGFCTYDREFVRLCRESGVRIIQDTTHSILSWNGIDPCCDYIVGSLRKWIGIPSGGFAIKTHGHFAKRLLEPSCTHLAMRAAAMLEKETWSHSSDPKAPLKLAAATSVFWDAEIMLRQMFDSYESDPESINIMKHIDIDTIRRKRQENYRYLLEHLILSPDFNIIFPVLAEETVPSHFPFFAKNRKKIQDYLTAYGVSSTVYWPIPSAVRLSGHPDAAYIYDHVFSLPCDQRYGLKEMQYICHLLNQYPKSVIP
ncbi:DegT/DnrJ/EryC1/StrS aminotransferase [Lacrimispora sp.]|uniref:DegT/DnrJ/EryC1/StrS aminotransferase n=1 Tax=Lacrimispora sp. TaxID=2719234 RepID=UPI0028A89169|nr:DegT/DnrJ/EryC1/StrS aminotransferase [Lacrimispora sp.]